MLFLSSKKCLNSIRLLEDILTVNNDSFKINVTPKIDQSFLRPRYPYERCINYGPGIRKRNRTVNVIEFSSISGNTENENIQLYFQDPVNGAQILPKEFEMKAQKIFKEFRTKI